MHTLMVVVGIVLMVALGVVLGAHADGEHRPANRAARKAKRAREKQAEKEYKLAWQRIDEASAKGENELLLEHGAEASKETMEKLGRNGFTVETVDEGWWRVNWRANGVSAKRPVDNEQ